MISSVFLYHYLKWTGTEQNETERNRTDWNWKTDSLTFMDGEFLYSAIKSPFILYNINMVFHKVKNCCQKFRPPHPFIYLFFIFVFRMRPYYSAHRCRGRNFGGLHCSHGCSGIGMFENSPGISMDFRYSARQLPLYPTAVSVDTKRTTSGLHTECGTATR